jgi:hypothetical protein
MFATQEETTRNIRKDTPPESDPAKIDRNAPAGGEDLSVLRTFEMVALNGR